MTSPTGTRGGVERSAEELAATAAAGSSACFDALVERFGPRLLRYLRQKVRDAHTAEDLLQETFLKAYRNLGRYDPGRPFAAWLFTIATRQAASFGRARPADCPAERIEPTDAGAESPLEAVARREQQENLWARASRELSADQFNALWLRYAEDMPVRQIAGVMGKSTVHVKVMLHRARRSLLRHGDGESAATVETERSRPAGACVARMS